MTSNGELWTEAGGALMVAALLPFYIGYLHLGLIELVLYSSVAAAMLTAGEHLRFGGLVSVSASELLSDFVLWAQLVLGIGVAAYLIALAAV